MATPDLAALEATIDALRGAVDELDQLRATVDALQAAVAERDGAIAELHREIDALHENLHCRDIDELTGMHNRRWLREWWAGLRQPSATVGAVALLDVDRLKGVNDTYGHKIGDSVITHVAAILLASGCYGVRYGGDEFLLFVPAGWDVEATLDRIVADIAACPVPTREKPVTVTVSCGARIVDDAMDLWQMIGDADRGMYEIKRSRPGTPCCRIVR